MQRTTRTMGMLLVWLCTFGVLVLVGMVMLQVQEGRTAAAPPLEAVDDGRRIAARIGADPAAVGRWMVLEEVPTFALGGLPDAVAKTLAGVYLEWRGEDEAASWVAGLDHAEGVVQAVLVYVRADGVGEPREEGGTAAVFCFPAREEGAWVPLFWDGPWADDRQASAKVLMGVCRAHAPLALEGLQRT